MNGSLIRTIPAAEAQIRAAETLTAVVETRIHAAEEKMIRVALTPVLACVVMVLARAGMDRAGAAVRLLYFNKG